MRAEVPPPVMRSSDVSTPQNSRIHIHDGKIVAPDGIPDGFQSFLEHRAGLSAISTHSFDPVTRTVNTIERTRRMGQAVREVTEEVKNGEWFPGYDSDPRLKAAQRERMWYALDHDRFESIYQTQHVVWDNGQPHRKWGEDPPDAELLTRLIEPQGVSMPGEFIDVLMGPEAQEEGLTRAFTLHCIRTAKDTARSSGHSISVNIHPDLFKDHGFIQALRQDSDLASLVVLELLETAPLPNTPFVNKALADLYRCGVRFAIDDFDPYEGEAEGNFSAKNLAQYKDVTGQPPYEVKLGHQVLVGAQELTDSELRAHLAYAMDAAIGTGASVLTVEAVNDGKQEGMVLEHLRTVKPDIQCRIQSRSLYGNKNKHGLTAAELSEVPAFHGSK